VKSIITYINSSYEEMKKVRWPTKKEATRLTGYVIGGSLIVGLFVAIFDYLFKEVLALLITG